MLPVAAGATIIETRQPHQSCCPFFRSRCGRSVSAVLTDRTSPRKIPGVQCRGTWNSNSCGGRAVVAVIVVFLSAATFRYADSGGRGSPFAGTSA